MFNSNLENYTSCNRTNSVPHRPTDYNIVSRSAPYFSPSIKGLGYACPLSNDPAKNPVLFTCKVTLAQQQ